MEKRQAVLVDALTTRSRLKRDIRKHLNSLGFRKKNGVLIPPDLSSKEDVRLTHRLQRYSIISKEKNFIVQNQKELSSFFADGGEIDPQSIQLRIERVRPGTREARLFRMACLTWSVPVSNGFGRRLRYLVWDAFHGKLAGLIALGDPVYNLRVRDQAIGWTTEVKRERLVDVLDAYVLGAVPPYNQLLVGKAIACLVRSREICEDFDATYGSRAGLISKKQKNAKLLAITTSSSLGRSSVYNRLKLGARSYFQPIGYTKGWGHFHISDDLFARMRDYLRETGHPYADGNRFGSGPNWRLRTIRVALQALDFDSAILKHGIRRQAFMCTLASNSLDLMRSGEIVYRVPDYSDLQSIEDINREALNRWIIPRSERDESYKSHTVADLLGNLSISEGSQSSYQLDLQTLMT